MLNPRVTSRIEAPERGTQTPGTAAGGGGGVVQGGDHAEAGDYDGSRMDRRHRGRSSADRRRPRGRPRPPAAEVELSRAGTMPGAGD